MWGVFSRFGLFDIGHQQPPQLSARVVEAAFNGARRDVEDVGDFCAAAFVKVEEFDGLSTR